MTYAEEAAQRAAEHGIVYIGTVQGKLPPGESTYCVGNCADVPVDVSEHDPRCSEYIPPVVRTDVMIHQLHILPHPNADKLEIAVVGGVEQRTVTHVEIIGGYRAIVPKGEYKTGDYALYIPEASILPWELIEELGLVGRLSGSGKNRVKAVRLRGTLSQGIVCRPATLLSLASFANMDFEWEYSFNHCNVRPQECDYCSSLLALNWAETLGIVKHQPRVPTSLRGRVRQRGTSRILPWIDIPNIKKVMDDFSPGEMVVATEKIHGTHCMITWDTLGNDGAGELLVSSKGIGKMGWDLVEDEDNVYWKAVRAAKLEAVLRWIAYMEPLAERIALYGEVYGPGIQDLTYGIPEFQFVAFDLRFDDMWINHDRFTDLLVEAQFTADVHVPRVPVLYYGPYSYDLLRTCAEGQTVLGYEAQIREGLVLRPVVERRKGDGSRVIAKFISESYLTRTNPDATEFE